MPRFESPKEAATENFKVSTAHAVRRKGWAVQNWAKVFWLIIFIIAFVTFIVFMVKLVQRYHERPRITAESRISGLQPDFPSVTVCDYSKTHVDDLHKLVIFCSFNGIICNYTTDLKNPEINSSASEYGTCFTFSSQRPVPDSGPDHGLDLFLYSPDEDENDISGFRVHVHQVNTRPMLSTQGVLVAPANEVLIGLDWHESERLSSGGCSDEQTHDGYTRTTETCDVVCTTSDCSCAPSCKETFYQNEVSVTSWPSFNHKNTINKTMLALFEQKNFTTPTPDYNTWINHMSAIKVFFKDYHKTTTVEKSAYTLLELLTHLGGVSALFIGFSFLTLFEAIDLIISLFVSKNRGEDMQPLSG